LYPSMESENSVFGLSLNPKNALLFVSLFMSTKSCWFVEVCFGWIFCRLVVRSIILLFRFLKSMVWDGG